MLEVLRQQRVRCPNGRDAKADPASHRFAGALRLIAQLSRPSAQAGRPAQFIDERLSLRFEARITFRVITGLGFVELPLQFAESPPVVDQGAAVEHRVARRGRGPSRRISLGELDGLKVRAWPREQQREVSKPLGMLEVYRLSLKRDRPDFALAQKSVWAGRCRFRARGHRQRTPSMKLSVALTTDRQSPYHARCTLPSI